MKPPESIVPTDTIATKIVMIRGEKVLLDRDLAELYGVTTKVLNQAVKRNARRFPSDFMFRLTREERDELVTNCDRFQPLKHSSSAPHAFTEQGVAMLSSVLNSERAIEVNILIMRAFVRLRRMISTHKELLNKLNEMEKTYDEQFRMVFEAIRELMIPPDKPRKRIGFELKEGNTSFGKRAGI